MSHEIETMFSVREKPWHYEYTKDKTRIIQEAPTAKDAIEYAGLNWEVQGRPIYDERGDCIHGYRANVRMTDKKVLGVVSDRYELIQNRNAFDFVDALAGQGLRYETAGSLRGGKQIWLLGKMPDRTIVGDKVEPYICFTNSHDGTGAVRCCMTPIRVVCNNTLNFALNSAKRTWATNHVGNVWLKADEARKTLMLADNYLTALDELGDKLANETMSDSMIQEVVFTLLPISDDATDRQKETVKQMRDGIISCTLAPDLQKFMNTKWGFVNAVADYADHVSPFRKTKTWEENRWRKIMYGHGLVDRALELVTA